jgi:hypothetical protein
MKKGIHVRFAWLLATASAALLSAACQTSKIASVWVPKDEVPRIYQRLMIVGLAPTAKDRERYENEFVDKLSNVDVLAIASINLVPDVGDIDRETVAAWLEEYALEGVVVTRVVDVAQKTEYHVPPSDTLGGWYGSWAPPSGPARAVESTTIALETNLYDAKSEKLLYSALTKDLDPAAGAVRDVIDALFEDMSKRGYLPAYTPR